MTIQLDLSPDIERGLLAQAQEQGLSLEAYAALVLQERSQATPHHPRKKTLVELFEPLRCLDLDPRRNPSTGRPVDWRTGDGHPELPTRAEQPQNLTDFGLQTEQHVATTPSGPTTAAWNSPGFATCR